MRQLETAIERHLTLAVEAARNAVAIAPADPDARHSLSVYQRKLDDLLDGQRERGASGKP